MLTITPNGNINRIHAQSALVMAVLRSVSGISAPPAQPTAAIVWEAPSVIDDALIAANGGPIFTNRNFRCTEVGVPAVRYNATQPVTLRGCKFYAVDWAMVAMNTAGGQNARSGMDITILGFLTTWLNCTIWHFPPDVPAPLAPFIPSKKFFPM